MKGNKFKRTTDAWTQDDLNVMHEVRRWRMVCGPGNIVTPRSPISYQPYMDGDYYHAKTVGSLGRSPWRDLCNLDPNEILSGDPFMASRLREGKLGIWDAAIAIPTSDIRPKNVLEYKNVTPLRNCNTTWLKQIFPAMHRVGPLGFEGEQLRPHGPYMLDLTANQYGWRILEAAHALAHLRGDAKPKRRTIGHALSQGETAGNFIGFIGEIVYSILYDVPLDTSDRRNGDPGEPDSCYGVEIKTSATFIDPVLKIPIKNREALQPDRTNAVVQMTVHVDPHPSAYEAYVDKPGPHDHWCCMPTIVGVAGWECVDVITHQPIAQDHRDGKPNPKAPKLYTMRAADLMEPGMFWGYLKGGRDYYGEPPVGGRWQYFHDWIESDAYQELLACTPPLICAECLNFVRTEAAPRRPFAMEKPELTAWNKDAYERDMARWEENELRKDNIKRVTSLVNQAVESYEKINVYKNRAEMTRTRRNRRKAHKARLQRLTVENKFISLHYQKLYGGYIKAGKSHRIPTLTQRKREEYARLYTELGETRVKTLIDEATKQGLLTL